MVSNKEEVLTMIKFLLGRAHRPRRNQQFHQLQNMDLAFTKRTSKLPFFRGGIEGQAYVEMPPM